MSACRELVAEWPQREASLNVPSPRVIHDPPAANDNSPRRPWHEIAELRCELKGDIVRVREQVASIETQLRDMKRTKLHARVADLEEKVFGVSHA